jgi:hypothetical protein
MGRFYFDQVCLVSRRLLIPEWAKLSSDSGKFMLFFLLHILHIPLACTSSPLVPMILRFYLLMESVAYSFHSS